MYFENRINKIDEYNLTYLTLSKSINASVHEVCEFTKASVDGISK